MVRDGGEDQLTDVFIGMVVEAVRPHRSDGHGEAWRLLVAHHDQIAGWVADDLTGVKIARAAGASWRRGAVRGRCSAMCWRCAAAAAGRGPTVRVTDGEPGDELQVDFGRHGVPRRPRRRAGGGWCTR